MGELSHTKFDPDREFAHAAGFAAARRCLRFLVTIISASLSIGIGSLSANGVDLSPISSVGRSVCVYVRKVYCGKTADWIRMPFGMLRGVGRGMSVLDGVIIVEGEWAVLG